MNVDYILKKFKQFSYGQFLVFGIGLLTVPILTRVVTPEDMGKYSLFDTISQLAYAMVILGLDQSFIRFYNEENEKGKSKLLRICTIISTFVLIIIALIGMIFYKKISYFIVGKESFTIYILLVFQVFLLVLYRFTTSQIRMSQKAFLFSFLQTLQRLCFIIVAYLFFLKTSTNYFILICGCILSYLVTIIWGILSERKIWRMHSTQKMQSSLRDILIYGIPFIFTSALTWLFQSIDKIMINAYWDYYEVGIYSGAMNIVKLLNIFQSAFVISWVPLVYEYRKKNPNDTSFYVIANRIVSYIMIMLATILILFKDVIIKFLGSEYSQAVGIFPFLLLMPIMYTISETTSLGINFSKKTYYHVIISAVAAICNILLNVILVPKYGAIGAAIATGISYFVFFILRTIISNKLFKVEYKLFSFIGSIIIMYIYCFYASFWSDGWLFYIIGLATMLFYTIIFRDVINLGWRYIKK
ncbi:lipopolysaccharide biosynthesis protein [Priestia megaterium]|uniref:lipopolysaccharide biosynthesis protein n=1 Tax=Priestia megaterium TaxID=1404 RepID=UPI001C24AD06|nr:oligosaccharide flippase family protein [Priestia megaterium]MBU8752324.1 oligosaccharide flippase family protein [Priestia megaterium]